MIDDVREKLGSFIEGGYIIESHRSGTENCDKRMRLQVQIRDVGDG
jgi:hypothetical protein